MISVAVGEPKVGVGVDVLAPLWRRRHLLEHVQDSRVREEAYAVLARAMDAHDVEKDVKGCAEVLRTNI